MTRIWHIGPEITYTPLPTGEYQFTLKAWEVKIEEEDSQYSKKGDERIQFTWLVAVPGKDSEERRDTVNIPASFSKKSTLRQILVALKLVDEQKAITDGVDLSEVVFNRGIGRSCMGTIVRKMKDDGKTPTDQITVYAALAETQVSPGTPPAAHTKLEQRLRALIAFAGMNAAETLPDGSNSEAMAGIMRRVGDMPMTEHANKQLTDAADLLSIMAQPSITYDAPTTLKDGLLVLDKYSAVLDASE